MKNLRRILVTSLGIGLIGGIAIEELSRQQWIRRYRSVAAEQKHMEQHYRKMVETHGALETELGAEREKTIELVAALTERDIRLTKALARLEAEDRTIHFMRRRMIAMEKQVEQLQGELVAAISRATESQEGAQASTIALERVVVGDNEKDASSAQGKIVSVHQDWRFVIIDLGWDTVHIGDMVSIVRDNQILGKARVERVQEDFAAAALFRDTDVKDIQINDRVQVL